MLFLRPSVCEVPGYTQGDEREAFLCQLMQNARGLLDRKPTSWQRDAAREFYTAAFEAENKGASCL